jgi:hypothetical protein
VRVASDGICVIPHHPPRVCYSPLELARVVALIFPHDRDVREVHIHVANTMLAWMTNALLRMLMPRPGLTIHVHLESLVAGDYLENAVMYTVLRAHHRLREISPRHFVRRVL